MQYPLHTNAIGLSLVGSQLDTPAISNQYPAGILDYDSRLSQPADPEVTDDRSCITVSFCKDGAI